MKAARAALDLVDGGAQSPKETWLRLLLIAPARPRRQIAVRNGGAGRKPWHRMGCERVTRPV